MTTPAHVQRCLAYRSGDQMFCADCGFVWDHNDPEPPVCSPRLRVKVTGRRKTQTRKFDYLGGKRRASR